MLLRRATLDRIVSGEVDLAFRRWKKPTVKTGGRLRTAVGELAIESVERVSLAELDAAQAKRAGFASKRALLDELAGREGALYRVRLSFAGADRRVALRGRSRLGQAERDALIERLERMDARARDGAWTRAVLELLAERPGVRAAELAAELDQERLPFKQRVRRLKELGLTESLEVGYRLSPRGKALLGGWKRGS